MKTLFALIFLAACFNTFAQDINVISYNIRYNNPGDGENAWPKRKDLVGQLLRFHEADIFGLQEAMIEQIEDICKALPEFKWVGVGRIDGKQAGEFSPVFYNSKKFKLIDNGNFWLAEDCTKPALAWDAACERVCSWAILEEKQSGKKILALNTHFDHVGKIAREKSAELTLRKIEEINTEKLPVILTGDFNTFPDTKPIEIIKTKLSNSKEISEQAPYGPEGTFNSFNFNHPLDKQIDFIFVNKKVKVKKYAVLTDSKNLHYPSDHLPVFVTIEL